MAVLLLFSILSVALALPSQESQPLRANCIKMTPEKEQQIDLIVEKLSDFLNNLTIEHEHFDIRLIKLSIEQHTEDEDEKETVLQLSVNDCELSDEELDEIEHHREKAKQQGKDKKDRETNNKEKDSKETAKKSQQLKQNDELKTNDHEDEKSTDNDKEVKQENPESSSREADLEEDQLNNNGEEVKPELMYLDLDEKGQQLLEAMGKKKKGPKIVYVQERNSGQTEYWFLKRR